MSKISQRQNKLTQIIRDQGVLPIRTMASMLGVSEMTIRRDLEALQCQTLEAPHALAKHDSDGYNILDAAKKADLQKSRIGEFAASLIEPNDVIIIDTGSTTAKILTHIPEDLSLTVLCYNANVLLELRKKPGIKLFMCGGIYHENTEMLESPEGIRFIERTRANKVFLSAAGIHEELGVTCANFYEVPTKNAVIKSSSEKILVADSSKFGLIRSSHFCDLADINVIVTDDNLSDEWKERILGKGISLYLK